MFVLLHRVAYEGDTLLGVYTTRELAEEAFRVWAEDHGAIYGTEMCVREVGVDAPAEMHW